MQQTTDIGYNKGQRKNIHKIYDGNDMPI